MVWPTARAANAAVRSRAGRALLHALILLGIGVFVVSWFAHATRDYVEVRVRAESVDWGAFVNCAKFASQPDVEQTFDLGWLKPQDIVSIEFRSQPRDDGTLRKGYFLAQRRVNGGTWETLKRLGSSGASVELPPFDSTAFIAGGSNLGKSGGCVTPPYWAFAASQLGRHVRPAARRDAVVFDIARAVGPWLLRAIAGIAAVALGLAYFARDRLALPARRVVESALVVPLALATVHLWLAVAASAAILLAAWHEHQRDDAAGVAREPPERASGSEQPPNLERGTPKRTHEQTRLAPDAAALGDPQHAAPGGVGGAIEADAELDAEQSHERVAERQATSPPDDAR